MKGRLIGSALLAASVGLAVPFLKVEEGAALKPYVDPVGVTTWCYGDTGPIPKTPLTAKLCDTQLHKRTVELCAPVLKKINRPLYAEQGAAICSWTYNVGTPTALKSTLVRKLIAGDELGAYQQFDRWVYAQGRDCRIRKNNCYGVVTRRMKEKALFGTYLQR